MTERTIRAPMMRREATIVDGSADAEANTVDVIWTAGATVRRRKWAFFDDEPKEFDEQLIVEPKAVRLDTLNAGASFLDSHDDWSLDKVLGSVVPGSARIVDGKGYATVRLSRAAGKADTIQDIKDKIVRNISVGYRVHRFEVQQRKDGVPLHRVTDWEPLEISAVAVPADPGAHVRSEDKGAFNDCVVTSETTEERSQNMATTDTETVTAPVDSVEVTQKIERAIADEASRVAEIEDICTRFAMPAEFRSKHIRGRTAVAAVKDAVLDEVAKRGSTVEVNGQVRVEADARDKFRAGVEKSLLGKAGHKDGERNEFSGLTLRELARESLRLAGVAVRHADPMEMVKTAMGLGVERRAAGMHSTSDFPLILANVASKSMMRGFEEAEETFERWTARGTLTDFKATKRIDLNLFPSLSKVPEGAEYSYATIGERGETVTLATYGKKFAITRQAIINDDMDVFSKIPMRMGRAARRTVGDLAYAVLTDNAAMSDSIALFHADHDNLSGAAAAPSVATVDAGKIAMAKQRDPDSIGAALNIRPAFILVPIEYEGTALTIMNSEFNPANTQRVPNYVRGLCEVISDARLSINSTTRWYMAANPNAVDTIEVSYLNGVSSPTLEEQMGWNVDGQEYKIRLDAAVKALDFRGLYANGT